MIPAAAANCDGRQDTECSRRNRTTDFFFDNHNVPMLLYQYTAWNVNTQFQFRPSHSEINYLDRRTHSPLNLASMDHVFATSMN